MLFGCRSGSMCICSVLPPPPLPPHVPPSKPSPCPTSHHPVPFWIWCVRTMVYFHCFGLFVSFSLLENCEGWSMQFKGIRLKIWTYKDIDKRPHWHCDDMTWYNVWCDTIEINNIGIGLTCSIREATFIGDWWPFIMFSWDLRTDRRLVAIYHVFFRSMDW